MVIRKPKSFSDKKFSIHDKVEPIRYESITQAKMIIEEHKAQQRFIIGKVCLRLDTLLKDYDLIYEKVDGLASYRCLQKKFPKSNDSFIFDWYLHQKKFEEHFKQEVPSAIELEKILNETEANWGNYISVITSLLTFDQFKDIVKRYHQILYEFSELEKLFGYNWLGEY